MKFFGKKKKHYVIYLEPIETVVNSKTPLECLIVEEDEPYFYIKPKKKKFSFFKWFKNLFKIKKPHKNFQYNY